MNLKKTYPSYFTLGVLVLYFVLCFLPGVLGIFYSFTDWNTYSTKVNFVGLANFKEIFSGSKDYMSFIKNTFVFTMATTIAKTFIGAGMALLLTNKRIKLANFQRMVIFAPQILSFLIVGIVFKNLLHPSNGFINIALRHMKLGFLAKNWLSDIHFAFPTVIAVDTWMGAGYIMVVVIAALVSISPSYYEAAKIDGASYWKSFHHITIPLILPVIVNVTVLNITYGFRVFDVIYALTNGGPGHATDVINTAVYREFSNGNYAMGTALSSLLFVFIMSISYFILKSMEGKEVEG